MEAVQIIDRTGQFSAKMHKAINAGLEAMAEFGAEKYKEHATAKEVSTEGRRSRPGQYPFKDTGVGSDNIAHEVIRQDRVSGYGVKQEGIHLFYLTGKRFRRRGAVEIFKRYRGRMATKFKRASKKAGK